MTICARRRENRRC